ncbi:hypothetical protein [Candidatus Vondammii sp. HM_W22]|uniref:hypothetical protein n=1 Tax=Candidatus Vondammii sp. HM_W22 TaxID=2687299 RepID=UPI002E7B4808|nr:hypothetical protein [Candidatus Vondammii sp. HM_W22]
MKKTSDTLPIEINGKTIAVHSGDYIKLNVKLNDSVLLLDIARNDVAVTVEGDNLILTLLNGAVIILEGYVRVVIAAEWDNAPEVRFAGGEIIDSVNALFDQIKFADRNEDVFESTDSLLGVLGTFRPYLYSPYPTRPTEVA